MSNCIIAIDGACRRNGKPDCVSAGAVFLKDDNGMSSVETTEGMLLSPSTNQRGELSAFIQGLELGLKMLDEGTSTVYFVTDSEYIFNSITKEWYKGWIKKGWVNADGYPIKNIDLWKTITSLVDKYDTAEQMVMYHIKGHVLSIGEVTAKNLANKGLATLYEAVCKKFEETYANPNKQNIFNHALALFDRNNGLIPPTEIFREMVICNTVADILASVCVKAYDTI